MNSQAAERKVHAALSRAAGQRQQQKRTGPGQGPLRRHVAQVANDGFKFWLHLDYPGMWPGRRCFLSDKIKKVARKRFTNKRPGTELTFGIFT